MIARLYAAPCGPLTALSGECSSCLDRLLATRQGLATSSNPLLLVKEVKRILHSGHEKVEKDMRAQVGISDRDMPGWSPWCEPAKVKNMHAAALLAEGNLEEYEAQAAHLTAGFAVSKPAKSAGMGGPAAGMR